MSRFLESSDLALTPGAPTPALDPAIKQRLLRHLDTCVAELDMDFCPEGDRDAVKAEADSEARPDSSTTVGGDENNNGKAVTSHFLVLWLHIHLRLFRSDVFLKIRFRFPPPPRLLGV